MKKSGKKPSLSPDERAARLAQAEALLEQGVDQMRNSEEFKTYLAAMRTFHRYSARNQLLIHMQRPTATHVASYNTWKKLGRQVRKGESGLKIYAPLKFSREATEAEKQAQFGTTDIDARVSGLKGFTLTSVFDIEQTDGEELPEYPARELGHDDNAQELLTLLIGLVQGFGWTIGFEPMKPGHSGYFDALKSHIGINEAVSNQQACKTLIHEFSHGINDAENIRAGKADDWYRAGAEAIAEGTAFVVCNALGIDTSQYTFAYLSGYGADGKTMLRCMDQIQKTAHTILDAIDAALGVARKEEDVAA